MFGHRSRPSRDLAAVPSLSADAPEGEVRRVVGVACMLDDVLYAVCSGRTCIAFSLTMTDRGEHEPFGWAPSPPFEDVQVVPFAVECELGRVRIDSQFARLELLGDDVSAGPYNVERWHEYCHDRGLKSYASRTEAVVPPGDLVTVAGIVQRRPVAPGVGAGYRDGGEQIVLVGDFDHPVIVGPPTA